MAHLAFLIRGQKTWQDNFINELHTRYVPYKIYDKKEKKLKTLFFQLRVCPIQLFDVVFPEDCWDAVANTILNAGKGEPMKPSHKKFIWAMRKAMKMEKIPDYKRDVTLAMSLPEHQEIIGIGYKEDMWINEDGKQVKRKDKTNLSQEAL